VINPLDIKEYVEHALDHALGKFGLSHWEDYYFVSGSYT
jgi:hypothetical protein